MPAPRRVARELGEEGAAAAAVAGVELGAAAESMEEEPDQA